MQTIKPNILSFMTGAFLFFLTLGSPETYADTTITLEQPVHFTTAEGSDVMLNAGTYTLEPAQEWIRITPSDGQSVEALLLEALAGNHEESLTTPLALSAKGEEADTHHLVVLLPGGNRLEAIGSYSGLRSRGTLSLLSIQRLKTLSTTQSTASPEYSTPLFGGSGGNQSYNLDCGSGSVLVGAIYKAGMWLDAIGIICQQVNSQTGALEREFTRGPLGGTGGQAKIARCASGRVFQGLRAFSGQYINKFYMRCSQWDASRKAPVFSEICNPGTVACLTFGGGGGSASDPFFCPAGMVGKAFRGRYGWYVDSARFVCDSWDK